MKTAYMQRRRGIRRKVVKVERVCTEIAQSQRAYKEERLYVEFDCGHAKLFHVNDPVKVGQKNRCPRCVCGAGA